MLGSVCEGKADPTSDSGHGRGNFADDFVEHTALSFTVELVEEPDLCRRVRLWPEPSDGAT
jgi:hypothetical protein